MIDPNDWRLHGQERFLKGVVLLKREYRRYQPNAQWDHDHCAFCWAKFMVEEVPEVLHEGYCTEDEYHWICASCFSDFRDHFEWKLAEAS